MIVETKMKKHTSYTVIYTYLPDLTWSYLILPDLTWSYLILPDLTWTQSFTFFNFIVFLMSLISLLLPGKTKDKQTLVKGAKQLKRCDTI